MSETQETLNVTEKAADEAVLSSTDWDIEVDAVVIGAGACGLVSGLRLADFGFDTIILEKMPKLHGNTAYSQGMIPAAGTRFQRELGIYDSPHDLVEDILRKNGGQSDVTVTEQVAERAKDAVEWLVDSCGLKLSVCTEFSYPGFSHTRMHAPPSRSGKELLRGLEAKAKVHPLITLVTAAPCVELVANPSNVREVLGVVSEQNGTHIRIRAKAVIIAANGYGANKQMVNTYLPEMGDALYFGHEGNDGDVIQMAVDLGAVVGSMSGYQAHASVSMPHGILITWGTMMTGGILLNARGQRFTNETDGYSEVALEVLAQPEGMAIELFDDVSYQSAFSIADFQRAVEFQAIRRFETLAAFATAFQISEAELCRTVVLYHEACVKENDEWGRVSKRPIQGPPYYGVRVAPALFHTQGGLKINQWAQVLRRDGQSFHNLYAGGGAAEGLSGNHPKGYLSGNGLLSAVTLGYIAGGHALQQTEAHVDGGAERQWD